MEFSRKEIDNVMFPKWYEEYKKLGGINEEEKFAYFLNVFFAVTKNAYTGGDVLSSCECLSRWIKFIGNKKEGLLYFKSVDNITSYS